MTESVTPNAATNTLPPVSVNGSAPPPQPQPAPAAPRRRKMNSRISGIRTAVIMADAGTARITQLRQIMRRDRRQSDAR